MEVKLPQIVWKNEEQAIGECERVTFVSSSISLGNSKLSVRPPCRPLTLPVFLLLFLSVFFIFILFHIPSASSKSQASRESSWVIVILKDRRQYFLNMNFVSSFLLTLIFNKTVSSRYNLFAGYNFCVNSFCHLIF